MKNFKLILIISIGMGVINSAKAQSSFYARAGAGFGFGLNPSVVDVEYTNSNNYNSTTNTYTGTAKNVQYSPGEGIYPEVAFGYMINGNVGFELGFSYAYGLTETSTNSSSFADSIFGSSSSNSTIKTSFHSFLITPAFVITGNNDKKLVPYARLGLIISIGSELTVDSAGSNDFFNEPAGFVTPSNSTGEEAAEVSGALQLGVAAAAGVTFKLSKHISIFGEVNARAFNFKFSQSNLTTYTYNGVNELPTLTTSEKQINYVNSITTTNTTTYPTGSPSQALTALVPVSTVGISVGVKIGFGGK